MILLNLLPDWISEVGREEIQTAHLLPDEHERECDLPLILGLGGPGLGVGLGIGPRVIDL